MKNVLRYLTKLFGSQDLSGKASGSDNIPNPEIVYCSDGHPIYDANPGPFYVLYLAYRQLQHSEPHITAGDFSAIAEAVGKINGLSKAQLKSAMSDKPLHIVSQSKSDIRQCLLSFVDRLYLTVREDTLNFKVANVNKVFNYKHDYIDSDYLIQQLDLVNEAMPGKPPITYNAGGYLEVNAAEAPAIAQVQPRRRQIWRNGTYFDPAYWWESPKSHTHCGVDCIKDTFPSFPGSPGRYRVVASIFAGSKNSYAKMSSGHHWASDYPPTMTIEASIRRPTSALNDPAWVPSQLEAILALKEAACQWSSWGKYKRSSPNCEASRKVDLRGYDDGPFPWFTQDEVEYALAGPTEKIRRGIIPDNTINVDCTGRWKLRSRDSKTFKKDHRHDKRRRVRCMPDGTSPDPLSTKVKNFFKV